MENSSPDSGLEFVLDNRRLILAFAVLIAVCGAFFVLGFIEGKRQGAAATRTAAAKENSADMPKSAEPSPVPKPAETPGGARSAREQKEQLDWYANVNKTGEANARLEPPAGGTKPQPARPASGTGTAPAVPKSAETSPAIITYTVQVGAFRNRSEAEQRAAALKSRGYSYVMDSPSEPTQPFYLIKVGKYSSRAEAVAMSLRLKKDGFSTFIKTN